jgi:hypothetical protein
MCPLSYLMYASSQVTFLEGASGLLACRAVLAHMNGDEAAMDRYVQVTCRW